MRKRDYKRDYNSSQEGFSVRKAVGDCILRMGNFFQNYFKFPIRSNLKFKRSRQFVTIFSIVNPP